MSNKGKSKIIDICFICSVIFCFAVFIIINIVGSDENFDWLIELVNDEVISANILLLVMKEESDSLHDCDCHSVLTVSTQSGVIFYRNDYGKYYALTALHGIPLNPDLKSRRIIVLGHEQTIPSEKENNYDTDLLQYYLQFPEAILEYYDIESDIAIISFYSENKYMPLSIASEPSTFNTPVIAIGNPGNERNAVTAGRIISREPVVCNIEDCYHKVIEHTAFVCTGNSGGALLNEKMEIVGILKAKIVDADSGEFLRGTAIPSDIILEFLGMAKKQGIKTIY